MDISPGWASAAAAVTSLVGGGLVRWVYGSLKDQKEDHAAELKSVRETVRTLFTKYDDVDDKLQAYKLHVAETYVNQSALEKMLAPIQRQLSDIEKDLRDKSK